MAVRAHSTSRCVAASRPVRRPALGHWVRRWLYLIHRWIGIASCLLFAMWFASGLVMIYVPYPSLEPAERLAHLAPIDWPLVTAPVPDTHQMKSVALEMRDGHPIWRLTPWEGDETIVSAEAGQALGQIDAAMVRRVATEFGKVPVQSLERVERDQWTVAQRFNRHRPLWKASLADRAGAELYISSVTGDVVQDTSRTERFWNWLGSVPHWIYPTILRQNGEAWRQVVIWVSGPCIAAALTGLWIGILRTRLGRRRFKNGRATPYHGWMLWHHIAGLVGGLFLIAWIFSGWLSVDPGRLFASDGISDADQRRYAGDLALPANSFRGSGTTVRAEAVAAVGSQQLLILSQANGHQNVLDTATGEPATLSPKAIDIAAARLMPNARVTRVDRLTAPDTYWYEVGKLPRLPVIRVQFDDPADTWAHIDPRTGQLWGSIDQKGRTYRWLFDLLHKWDLNALTLRRPLWDILLWIMSLLGLVTSVSGVCIGWKRLRRRTR